MTIWFVSDTHFGHSNILTFKKEGGDRLRSEFDTVDEMDEAMIDRWNMLVKVSDKIYHCGDVGFGDRERLGRILRRLNGHKRLILGNHDHLGDRLLFTAFEKIVLWRVFGREGFAVSHMPLRDDGFRHHCVLNVHGHIHAQPDPSPHHMNVSVERTGYAPVSMDEVMERVKNLK